MEGYSYQFVALRGIQAGYEYYVAMCPIKLVPRLFRFDEEELPAELRAQRTLNRARIPEISRYILNNPSNYTFSSITACIDGDVVFEPFESHGFGRSAGLLSMPMSCEIVINDGQHRRAAIEQALKEKPSLGDETISVVFFRDAGLKRSQQMFADLNQHAVRPTRSIGILYNHRDPLARLCVALTKKAPIFQGRIETEKSSISNRSRKLFTLSGLYQASQALLNKKAETATSDEDLQRSIQYWTRLGEVIHEWRLVIQNEVTASVLRKEYVHVHGVMLHALGYIGRTLIEEHPEEWRTRLQPLGKVNWLRTNSEWEGRAIVNGRMSKMGDSVPLTVNKLKMILNLPLNANDQTAEDRFQNTGDDNK
ncbi:MAG: DNA sulfur modification protein DndB [Candidatus Promineifilaceae bacterium]